VGTTLRKTARGYRQLLKILKMEWVLKVVRFGVNVCAEYMHSKYMH
jgi:hypothetical protein